MNVLKETVQKLKKDLNIHNVCIFIRETENHTYCNIKDNYGHADFIFMNFNEQDGFTVEIDGVVKNFTVFRDEDYVEIREAVMKAATARDKKYSSRL